MTGALKEEIIERFAINGILKEIPGLLK